MALARPWGMPVRPPTSWDRPWWTPIDAFWRQRPPSTAPSSMSARAVEVVGSLDHRAAAPRRSRPTPARAIASASGRARRRPRRLDAVGQGVHAVSALTRGGVSTRQLRVVDRRDSARGSARRRRSSDGCASSVMPKNERELGTRVGGGDRDVGQRGAIEVRGARRAGLLLGEEGDGLAEVGARAAAERHDAVDAVAAGLQQRRLDDVRSARASGRSANVEASERPRAPTTRSPSSDASRPAVVTSRHRRAPSAGASSGSRSIVPAPNTICWA